MFVTGTYYHVSHHDQISKTHIPDFDHHYSSDLGQAHPNLTMIMIQSIIIIFLSFLITIIIFLILVICYDDHCWHSLHFSSWKVSNSPLSILFLCIVISSAPLPQSSQTSSQSDFTLNWTLLLCPEMLTLSATTETSQKSVNLSSGKRPERHLGLILMIAKNMLWSLLMSLTDRLLRPARNLFWWIFWSPNPFPGQTCRERKTLNQLEIAGKDVKLCWHVLTWLLDVVTCMLSDFPSLLSPPAWRWECWIWTLLGLHFCCRTQGGGKGRGSPSTPRPTPSGWPSSTTSACRSARPRRWRTWAPPPSPRGRRRSWRWSTCRRTWRPWPGCSTSSLPPEALHRWGEVSGPWAVRGWGQKEEKDEEKVSSMRTNILSLRTKISSLRTRMMSEDRQKNRWMAGREIRERKRRRTKIPQKKTNMRRISIKDEDVDIEEENEDKDQDEDQDVEEED